jgi:hypothetical protein
MILRFGAGFAAAFLCGAALVACSAGGSSGTQPATVPGAAQQSTVAGALGSQRRSAGSGVRRTLSVPNCSGTGADAFVGGGIGNVAGGELSVVGAGEANQSCDGSSSVLAGYDNAVSGTGYYGFIGGGESNAVTGSDTDSAVVAGDQNEVSNTESAIVGGASNSVSTSYGLLGGGQSNAIKGAAEWGFVGGGHANTLTGLTGAMAGGYNNQNAGTNALLGAGESNVMTSSAADAVLGGGSNNSVSSEYGVIAGGVHNTVSGEGGYIAAGGYNTVAGEGAVADGGFNNSAAGTFSTIPGGYANSTEGTYSFAAGVHADANKTGTFVWSDGSDGDTELVGSVPYEFLARASGGVRFWTNAAATVGAYLAPGSGAWSSASDRNLKTGVTRIDDAAVLDKVATLPIDRWSYESEHGVRHIGPMAQDFYAAFKVGEDDKHITSIDEDGVALAAIKALHRDNEALHIENFRLRTRLVRSEAAQRATNAATQQQIRDLKAAVAALSRR